MDDLKVKLDTDYLEATYAKAVPAAVKPGDNKPVKIEAVKVTLLGPERTKNMELVLGKLKMPFN